MALMLAITALIARNPDAVGKNGMVVSSHKLASNTGIEILKSIIAIAKD